MKLELIVIHRPYNTFTTEGSTSSEMDSTFSTFGLIEMSPWTKIKYSMVSNLSLHFQGSCLRLWSLCLSSTFSKTTMNIPQLEMYGVKSEKKDTLYKCASIIRINLIHIAQAVTTPNGLRISSLRPRFVNEVFSGFFYIVSKGYKLLQRLKRSLFIGLVSRIRECELSGVSATKVGEGSREEEGRIRSELENWYSSWSNAESRC